MRATNSFIGSPIERVEDLRFLRGRGQYVDDLTREGLLHAAILRSAVAHGRIRSIDVVGRPGAPRRPRRHHGRRHRADSCRSFRCGSSPCRSLEPFDQPVIAAGQGSLCRRAGRHRASPRAPALAEDALDAHRARNRSAAGGGGSPSHPPRTKSCCSRTTARISPSNIAAVRGDADAAFHARRLRPSRELRVQRHTGGADGAARRAGRMGCGAGQAHRLGRRQGAVLQPPHPGEADGPRRRCDRHDRERRRRRLRRARRVLSGGFSHPLRRRATSAGRSSGSRTAASI